MEEQIQAGPRFPDGLVGSVIRLLRSVTWSESKTGSSTTDSFTADSFTTDSSTTDSSTINGTPYGWVDGCKLMILYVY